MSNNDNIIPMSGSKEPVDTAGPTPTDYVLRYYVGEDLVEREVTGFYGMDTTYVYFINEDQQSIAFAIRADSLVDLRPAS